LTFIVFVFESDERRHVKKLKRVTMKLKCEDVSVT